MMESMGMISCHEALSKLWEYLDGELPPEDEAAVKRHLDICDRCFPHYDFQSAYFEYTRQIKEQEHAPPSLKKKLFRRILEQESNDEREP